MVVSNTSPLNYLILIGQGELLGTLRGELHVPRSALDEPSDPATPEIVRN